MKKEEVKLTQQIKAGTSLLVKEVVEGVQDKKGRNIVVIDLQKLPDRVCDYMVIAEGNSPTQVEALEGAIYDRVQKQLSERPLHSHRGSGEWIAMDYGDVMVHLFVPPLRQHYDLEGLWADGEVTRLPDLD